MKKTLHIGPGLDLPIEVVTESIAILAKRREGKSYLARKLVEEVHKAGQQIIVLDPKGDWWGLRSAADGKGPGLPFVIVGGEHGDVPLEPGGGGFVASLAVNERVPMLIDLSALRKHEVATFCAFFLETLYRLKAKGENQTPLLVVIDEADAIAPQNSKGSSQSARGEGKFDNTARMLGAAEDLVRRGGQRGIGVVLVSQRAAVLNKNVLTQAGILVLLKTTGSQDIDAVDEWIKKHGEPEKRAQVMAELASLPRGRAWWWAPGWPTDDGLFVCTQCDPIETFDSGRTPKPGETRHVPKTAADVDLAAFRTRMAETIQKAEADDPKKLRARIKELEREIAAKPKAEAAKPIVQHMLGKGDAAALERAAKRLLDTANSLEARIVELLGTHTLLKERAAAAQSAGDLVLAALTKAQQPPHSVAKQAEAPRLIKSAATPARAADQASSDGSIAPARQRILNALAMLESVGIAQPSRVQLALWCAVSPKSSGYSNNLGGLRSQGLIDYPTDNAVTLTDDGLARAVVAPVPAVEDFQQKVLGMLAPARAAIVSQLIAAHPNALSRDDLAKRVNVSAASSGFSNNLGALRSLGVLDYPSNGQVAATPVLFLG